MAKVQSLGYLRLISDKFDAWPDFATEVLGVMPVQRAWPEGAQHYRWDDHPYRLVVRPGDEFAIEAMGYQVLNSRDLDCLVTAIEGEGITVKRGSEAECADREVAGFVSFQDPSGTPLELFYGPKFDHVPLRHPYVSQFVADQRVGMGHTAIAMPDSARSAEFYIRVLGFHERNTMRRNGRTTWFLSPNSRQHTLGLATSDAGLRFSHFMVEMATIDDVGRALDRVEANGTPLYLTMGRHTNDRMLSFYVFAPDGFSVEIGCQGLMVEEPSSTFEIATPSEWGHRRVREREGH